VAHVERLDQQMRFASHVFANLEQSGQQSRVFLDAEHDLERGCKVQNAAQTNHDFLSQGMV